MSAVPTSTILRRCYEFFFGNWRVDYIRCKLVSPSPTSIYVMCPTDHDRCKLVNIRGNAQNENIKSTGEKVRPGSDYTSHSVARNQVPGSHKLYFLV